VPTSGSGEVNVDGRYKAYGQDLTIQEGRLLFANSPLDNPNLNLTAVRVVEEVTAGLRVTGSAKNPVLTIFSDPPMAQTEALSYLVAGKPLDQIRQSEGEGDAVQTAARSLGTAAGGLLAKNVGKRLGVDEFGIKDNEMIGGAAFTVGQYLSPRLYLSYGVGLFEPGEVVTLRYKLTNDLSLQAQSGTNESRAGIEYRMER
jgi:translocation and assembly module TamB